MANLNMKAELDVWKKFGVNIDCENNVITGFVAGIVLVSAKKCLLGES